jgi:glycosyltransferase involved in cell wall biosynthesis
MSEAPRSEPPIAVFMAFSGDGGVERMVTQLLQGFVNEGRRVDLVLARARGGFIDQVPAEVSIVHLGSEHTYASLPALCRYLRRVRPRALLVAKHRAGIVAVLARKLCGYRGRLVLRLGTTVSAALQGRGRLRRVVWFASMRHFYPAVDRIVAVSDGVRRDVLQITGLPEDRVSVIPNPVVTPAMAGLARQPVEHVWLQPGQPPAILASGRYTRQKDFPTLIRAFARVHEQMSCHLIILGRGSRQALHDYQRLAADLGVGESISFPGFVANPYAYVARASLFVLSSIWEGSPNVLTEALALGVPVVATDCPSGPREILRNGEYGPLVPMGDVGGLARAMLAVLQAPPAADFLRQAVVAYDVDASARAYLEALDGA